jgi:hypothetical protein
VDGKIWLKEETASQVYQHKLVIDKVDGYIAPII